LAQNSPNREFKSIQLLQGFVWPKNPQTGNLKSIQNLGDNKMSKDTPDSEASAKVTVKGMTASTFPRH
jgi:hypothetical protein